MSDKYKTLDGNMRYPRRRYYHNREEYDNACKAYSDEKRNAFCDVVINSNRRNAKARLWHFKSVDLSKSIDNVHSCYDVSSKFNHNRGATAFKLHNLKQNIEAYSARPLSCHHHVVIGVPYQSVVEKREIRRKAMESAKNFWQNEITRQCNIVTNESSYLAKYIERLELIIIPV